MAVKISPLQSNQETMPSKERGLPLRLLDSQQQDQLAAILKQHQDLSEKEARRTPEGSADHLQKRNFLRKENQELQKTVGQISAASDWTSNLLTPELQHEIRVLKAQLGVLASQTPAESPWELMSERAPLKSASSPAPSSDLTRATGEVQQIDAKVPFSTKSIAKETH